MLAGASLLASGIVLACAGDDDPGLTPVRDASSEASLATEGGAADVEVPSGDPCGDRGGLLQGATWPLRGGCPKRAGLASQRTPSDSTVKWSVPRPASSDPASDASGISWIGTEAGDLIAVSSNGTVVAALATGGAVTSSPALAVSGVVVVGTADNALLGIRRGAGPASDAGVDGGDPDGGEDAGPRPTARVVFRLALPGAPASPVIGGDGTIYVGTKTGTLVAAAADGSSVLWTADTGDTRGSSPAIGDDGTVYVGSSAGHLDAYDGKGKLVFRYETGSPVTSSPSVGRDGTIFVGTEDGALHAVTPAGKPRFRYATGGAIESTPAVSGLTVYVGGADKKLHAVDVTEGKARWTFQTLGALGTPAVAAEGNVVVGSADGKLYVVAPSGLLVYAVNVKGAVRSGPAFAADGTVVVGTSTGVVAVGP